MFAKLNLTKNDQKKENFGYFLSNYTSLAAPKALAHLLQRHTILKEALP